MTVEFMLEAPAERQEKLMDVWSRLRYRADGGYDGEEIAGAILASLVLAERVKREIARTPARSIVRPAAPRPDRPAPARVEPGRGIGALTLAAAF